MRLDSQVPATLVSEALPHEVLAGSLVVEEG